MTDTFNVTASYNQNTYSTGQTIVVSISGDDIETTTTYSNGTAGPINLTISAADGVTEVITVPAVTVNVATIVTTNNSVKITGVTDLSSNPRVWTIAINGLSVTAIA